MLRAFLLAQAVCVVALRLNATQIAAGTYHTCALFNGGFVKCWGEGQYGRLGTGVDTVVMDPSTIGFINVGGTVTQMTAGDAHTCVLLADASVKCFGAGSNGQLGYNSTNNVYDPSILPPVDVGGPAIQVAAGALHTCVLLANHSMKCFGEGGNGQLGYGCQWDSCVCTVPLTGTSRIYSPALMGTINVGGPVKSIATGGYHTCAMLMNSSVVCFGFNVYSQLGYGSGCPIAGWDGVPTSLGTVHIGGSVAQVAAGTYSTCVLLSNSSVKCFGDNSEGELGYNTTSPSTFGVVNFAGRTTQVIMGYMHTCLLMANVSLTCFGRGYEGQLGTGSFSRALYPNTQVQLSSPPIQATAGFLHTCVLLTTGAVQCFGANGHYQLGYSSASNLAVSGGDIQFFVDLTPTPAVTPSPAPSYAPYAVAQVVAAWDHTCVLFHSSGAIKCWGYNNFGQLGVGTFTDVYSPTSIGNINVGGRVTQIAVGAYHTCVVLSNHSSKCWGHGVVGQLGYNTTVNIASPESVGIIDVGGNVAQIAAGEYHTCALTSAGDVKCWGDGSYGQLGIGCASWTGCNCNLATGGTRLLSPALSAPINLGQPAIQIAASGYHTCAILQSKGLICWGFNSNGRLGYGTSSCTSNNWNGIPVSLGLVNVGGPVLQVAPGEFHTCALVLVSGLSKVKCWGYGGYGQLGYNSSAEVNNPSLAGFVDVGGDATSIAAGYLHTCAVVSGAVQCWGSGGYGELGNKGFNDSSIPVDILLDRSVTSITAGFHFTCVVTSSATIRCWGYNGYAMLGVGPGPNTAMPTNDVFLEYLSISPSPSSSVTPSSSSSTTVAATPSSSTTVAATPSSSVPPGGSPKVVQIDAGAYHTCILLSDGTIKCFGAGGDGQLGYGNGADVYLASSVGPIDVGGQVIQIVTGGLHTCALLTNFSMKCWGHNSYGQLGYNTISAVYSPAFVGPVDVGGSVTQIVAGDYHTCALLADGSIKCWGNGYNGQLGYQCRSWTACQCNLTVGGLTYLPSPALVGPIQVGGPVRTLASGGYHVCATLMNSSVVCFGYNSHGQLGYGTSNCPPFGWSGIAVQLGFVNIGNVSKLTLGHRHTCAQLANSSTKCWGHNGYGPLGYYSTTNVYAPASVGPISLAGNVTIVEAGYRHTCAVMSSPAGSLLSCWGDNIYGQLFNGNFNSTTGPGNATFFPGRRIIAVAAFYHTCLLFDTGTIQCAGDNVYGQNGYGLGPHSASAPGDVVVYVDPSPTVTPSMSQTSSTTSSFSVSPSGSMASSASSSVSASGARSATPSHSASAASTQSFSPTASGSASPAISSSMTATVSAFATRTVSHAATESGSPTASSSASPSAAIGALRIVDVSIPPATLQVAGSMLTMQPQTLSFALPARKISVHLANVRPGSLVYVCLACIDKHGQDIVVQEWTSSVAPGNVVNVWLWAQYTSETRGFFQHNSTLPCVFTARQLNSAATATFGMAFETFPTQWAAIGDIITMHSSPDGVVIHSALAGRFPIQTILHAACCPGAAQGCDLTTCGISNSSLSSNISLTAAVLFRARLESFAVLPVFSMLLAPGTLAVLVSADFMQRLDLSQRGPYTNLTRVYVGGIQCEVEWVHESGHFLGVRMPRASLLCPHTSGNTGADCGYKPLRVEAPIMEDETGPTFLGSVAECPPVCPGMSPPDSILAPVADDSGTQLEYVQVALDSGLSALSVPSGSSVGLYFTASCTASGFQSLTVDICTNTTHPQFILCPFGAGEACRVCPRGAMCPGGFRAWPLPGYFTAAESSGVMLECPAPAGRCVGWDVAAGVTNCGVGYKDGSYLCTSCGIGFYAALDGTCTACPAHADVTAAVIQLATFVGIVLGGLLVLYVLCVLLLRVLGGTTHNLTTTFMNLVIWTFITLQIVGQVGKTASTGLPATVRSMYEALLVFQFEGATIPAACTGADPMRTQWILCACILSILSVLACTYGTGVVSKSLGQWVQSKKLLGIGIKGLVLLLSVSYAPVVNNLLDMVTCTSAAIPVRAYLAMRQDGSALASAGISLPQQPTRSDLDTMLTVSLLVSDPSQICYESLHATVYPLSVLCLVCYVILYPVAVVIYVTSTVTALHPITGSPRKGVDSQLQPTVASLSPRDTWCARRYDMEAVDSSPDVLTHVLLRPFTNAQFRASYILFLLVDSWLQCALATIGIVWRYPSSIDQSRGKAAVLCAILLLGAWAYEFRRPFRVGRGWKTHVKAFSLLLCAIGAVENALLTEMPPAADGSVSDTVTGWSLLLVIATVVLLLLLAGAFMYSMFAEQTFNLGLLKWSLQQKAERRASFNRLARHSSAQRLSFQAGMPRSHLADSIKSVLPVDEDGMVLNPLALRPGTNSASARQVTARRSVTRGIAPVIVRAGRTGHSSHTLVQAGSTSQLMSMRRMSKGRP